MKLPENKKERIQVFALIGVGAIAVLFALWQLGVAPFLASKQKLIKTLASKMESNQKAELEVERAPALKAEFDSLASELDQTINNNVLRPILGSYLVGVTETLEAQARAINLKLDEIQEIGIREPPRRSSKKGNVAPLNFKSYSVQVSTRASFDQTKAFINKLEELNPYLCISEIRIVGQPDAPEFHRLNLKIEWPIEAEPAMAQGTISDRGGES